MVNDEWVQNQEQTDEKQARINKLQREITFLKEILKNKNTLTYKEFVGSINTRPESKTMYGKIENINDLVTYEGRTIYSLEDSFKEAVDDYIKTKYF